MASYKLYGVNQARKRAMDGGREKKGAKITRRATEFVAWVMKFHLDSLLLCTHKTASGEVEAFHIHIVIDEDGKCEQLSIFPCIYFLSHLLCERARSNGKSINHQLFLRWLFFRVLHSTVVWKSENRVRICIHTKRSSLLAFARQTVKKINLDSD